MRKRRPSPGREPRPAFTLLTAVLIGTALVATVGLDYLSSRRSGRSYIFGAAAEAPAAQPTPPGKPVEKIVPAPAPQPPAARPFDEVVAATLAAAGVSEDSTLRLKGPRGRPLFEVEIPAELYESLGPAVEKALAAQGIRVLDKKRTPGEDRTEILWALRRPAREEASVSFVLPVEPPPVARRPGWRPRRGPRAAGSP